MVVWSRNSKAKAESAWFLLKSTDSLNVTLLLNNHLYNNTSKEHIPALLMHLFDLGRSRAPPFGGSSALSFRNHGAGTDPHSHCASESLSWLLNTDTSPQTHTHTHTHTQAACHANHHCTDDLSTEDTLCLRLGAPAACFSPSYLPRST